MLQQNSNTTSSDTFLLTERKRNEVPSNNGTETTGWRGELIDAAGDRSILYCPHCHTMHYPHERAESRHLQERDHQIILMPGREGWRNVQHNVQMMDRLHDAHFHDWIKKEEHAGTAVIHLQRIVREYSIERVANGLRWLFVDWRLGTIAMVLSELFFTEYYDLGLDKLTTLLNFYQDPSPEHMTSSPYKLDRAGKEKGGKDIEHNHFVSHAEQLDTNMHLDSSFLKNSHSDYPNRLDTNNLNINNLDINSLDTDGLTSDTQPLFPATASNTKLMIQWRIAMGKKMGRCVDILQKITADWKREHVQELIRLLPPVPRLTNMLEVRLLAS